MNNKNIGFKNPQNWHFCKGVSPWFWSKILNGCESFFLCKIHPEKTYLVTFSLENKGFLDNINMNLKRRQNWNFYKGNSP